MSPKHQATLILGLVATLCVAPASVAAAQQQTMETVSEVIDVTVTSGTVVYRVGNTVVVRVEEGTHKGLQKFVLGSQAKITRNGVPAHFSELRKGDKLVKTLIQTRRYPALITMGELKEMEEALEETSAAPAPEPMIEAPVEPEPMAEALPVDLPQTASSLPLIALIGLMLAISGLAVLASRRLAR